MVTSPFLGTLDNATVTFKRATAYNRDARTYNMVPSSEEAIEARVYFKSIRPQKDREPGLDNDVYYEVRGFAAEIEGFSTWGAVPDWVKPGLVDQACVIDEIGSGLFNFEPRIHAAQALVEDVAGLYIQGTFRIPGGGLG